MNVIDKARERIERAGLHKGGYGDYRDPDSPVCILGAFNAVTGHIYMGAGIAAVRLEIEAEIGQRQPSIPDWNDDPSTSLEDVLLLMKRASARLDEAGV